MHAPLDNLLDFGIPSSLIDSPAASAVLGKQCHQRLNINTRREPTVFGMSNLVMC
jgi:hypothetical protein